MDSQNQWAVNESLLQSYRSTFIASQSFLLAVGAILSGRSAMLVYLTALISLLVIWWIWFPVVRSRHRIVDYYKFSGTLDPSSRASLCTEHEYVNDAELRKKANALFKIETNWRTTRKKMDIWIPVLFSVVWAGLVAHEVFGI